MLLNLVFRKQARTASWRSNSYWYDLESFLSYKILRLSYEDLISITKTIIYFLKIKIENSQIIEILNLLKHDKKTVEGKINFVLLNGISDTKIDV